jgi:hypothetical protein
VVTNKVRKVTCSLGWRMKCRPSVDLLVDDVDDVSNPKTLWIRLATRTYGAVGPKVLMAVSHERAVRIAPNHAHAVSAIGFAWRASVFLVGDSFS